MRLDSAEAIHLSSRVLGWIFVLSVRLAASNLGLAAQSSGDPTEATKAAPATTSVTKPSRTTAGAIAQRAPVVKRTAGVRHSAPTRSSTRSPRKSSGKMTARAPRRSRPLSYRRRMARLRPEPQRIAEIQRALAQAGYLRQEPSGTWDPATRDAMQRFQQEHGFPATGLPEAKSLMKLGLGPHPLPEDADPSVAARTSAGASSPASTPADPSPPRKEH